MGKEPSGLTAAILAGGLGTRLRAVVRDVPKVLAPVAGRPFLFHLLDQISEAGIRHVVLCTGYKAEQVRQTIGNDYKHMEIDYSEEQAPLGTAGAIRKGLPLYRSDPVLVMNGDSCCYFDLSQFLSWHVDRKAAVSLLLAEVPDTNRFGRVQVTSGGEVLQFEEKGVPGSGWINAGLYLFGRTFLESIPADGIASLERDVLPAWIGKGLLGYPCAGRFIDIGTEEDYSRADRFFRDIGKGRAT